MGSQITQITQIFFRVFRVFRGSSGRKEWCRANNFGVRWIWRQGNYFERILVDKRR